MGNIGKGLIHKNKSTQTTKKKTVSKNFILYKYFVIF